MIRVCENFGRDNYYAILESFPTKTMEEVKEYCTAFWKNWELIDNGHKYVERIEKGEQDI